MASERIERCIDILLDEADAAVSRYDWEAVRQAANAVLAIAPDNGDATTFLAVAERALGTSAPQPTTQPATPTPPTSVATTTHPTSFANGRYQVKEFLGEGSKKKVYLAQDTLLDREVAFAKGGSSRPKGWMRLDAPVSRERPRPLDGLAPINTSLPYSTSMGQEQDQPYVVIELMGGGDVEGIIEK